MVKGKAQAAGRDYWHNSMYQLDGSKMFKGVQHHVCLPKVLQSRGPNFFHQLPPSQLCNVAIPTRHARRPKQASTEEPCQVAKDCSESLPRTLGSFETKVPCKPWLKTCHVPTHRFKYSNILCQLSDCHRLNEAMSAGMLDLTEIGIQNAKSFEKHRDMTVQYPSQIECQTWTPEGRSNMAVQHPLQDFARPSCGLEGRFGPGGAFAAAPSGLNKSQRQRPNFESGTICSWPPRLKVAWTCQEQLTNGEPQRPTENQETNGDQCKAMESNGEQRRATESNGEQEEPDPKLATQC